MKKMKITTKQLIRVLQTELPKYPIKIIMAGVDKEELEEIIKLLKSKDKDK